MKKYRIKLPTQLFLILKNNKPSILNRTAKRNYEFVETFVAGIQLWGTEVKSLRESRVNMQDAFCVFNGDELFVKNMHISPYEKGSYTNHDPLRPRKLLLHKRELRKMKQKLKEKGYTIVPTRLFFNDRNLAKIEIAMARGKKTYDKREDLKKRDHNREIERSMK